MEQVEVSRRVEQMLRTRFGSELIQFGQLVDQRTRDLFVRGALPCAVFWEFIADELHRGDGDDEVWAGLDALYGRMFDAVERELELLLENVE